MFQRNSSNVIFRSTSRRRFIILGGVLLLAIAALLAVWNSTVSRARSLPPGITSDQWRRAAADWQSKYGHPPDHAETCVLLGDSLASAKEFERAVACYAAIPAEHPVYGLSARLEQARALLKLNRAAAAEEQLRTFIDGFSPDARVTPQQVADALDLLRFLLDVQLRFEERSEILRVMHEIECAERLDTLAYCFPGLLRWNGPQAVQWLEDFWKESPDDFHLRVALGRYRTGEGRLDEAQMILEKCCRERPQSLPAAAALIACEFERDDWKAMERILKQLPPRSPEEPWLLLRLRGHFHNHEAEFSEALACFQDALAADPANSDSQHGLVRALEGLNRAEERLDALRKVKTLSHIQNRLGWAQTRVGDVTPVLEIARSCQEIGLTEQALLLANLAKRESPGDENVAALLEDLRRE